LRRRESPLNKEINVIVILIVIIIIIIKFHLNSLFSCWLKSLVANVRVIITIIIIINQLIMVLY